jgi:hypothetical protein
MNFDSFIESPGNVNASFESSLSFSLKRKKSSRIHPSHYSLSKPSSLNITKRMSAR